MVGVPTSKGCLLCLQRSVKCDEERPSCAQCRRGGRTCPGYVREMKFVDEGPKVRRSRRKDQPGQVSKGNGRHNGGPIHHHQKTNPDVRLGQPSTFKAERDQVLSSFVSDMFPLGSSTAQISFLGSWLWHLPPRLGSSAVLDHAALSVAWAYFAKVYGDSLALRNAELSYLCAVRSLASALDDAKEQLSSNVLCATVLLGHFETFVNVSYAWIRHAGGAARLMQLRGAERCYESAFDYSMFLACRGAIVGLPPATYSTNTHSFLDIRSFGVWTAVHFGVRNLAEDPRRSDRVSAVASITEYVSSDLQLLCTYSRAAE
ncbi:hypothetical protein NOF04DRAFT_1407037 [Fusarium oxysporum II5]|nr:hypothetical protein NOF04DRAFT_1407037 [Fusarium oxysporum II5]